MVIFSTFLLSNIDLSLLFHYLFPTLRTILIVKVGMYTILLNYLMYSVLFE